MSDQDESSANHNKAEAVVEAEVLSDAVIATEEPTLTQSNQVAEIIVQPNNESKNIEEHHANVNVLTYSAAATAHMDSDSPQDHISSASTSEHPVKHSEHNESDDVVSTISRQTLENPGFGK